MSVNFYENVETSFFILKALARGGGEKIQASGSTWRTFLFIKVFCDPDSEKERNRLFSALQQLVVETLRVTEQMPERKPALERFRKTKKEYAK